MAMMDKEEENVKKTRCAEEPSGSQLQWEFPSRGAHSCSLSLSPPLSLCPQTLLES